MKNYSILLGILLILFNSALTKYVESKAIEGRIVSGEPAVLGELPWQVLLKTDEVDTIKCGGSILSECWVITAAHCLTGLYSVFLAFGTVQLDDTSYNMTSKEMYIHPKYLPPNINDIALIKLPRPLIFSETIQPIALVSASQVSNNFLSSTAIIAGFGITDDENTEYSQILLWAKVTIVPIKKCQEKFQHAQIDDTNICALGYGDSNMSTCSGDSGGPLIEKINGTIVQIGINSFVATDQCTEGLPSGYVAVTAYEDFIEQITNGLQCLE